MLTHLSVQNLAIIESAEVDFAPDLNVITGETGSGKSVLMSALALALGARADASTVREGSSHARVEAEFLLQRASEQNALKKTLDRCGLPTCEENRLTVRRLIASSGGSRVFINDAPSTVQTLRTLGQHLVDVHGPNDHQALIEEPFQRALLDTYARLSHDAYDQAWFHYTSLQKEISSLENSETTVKDEIERTRFCVNELDEAHLSLEEDVDLPARHACAAHTAEILEAATTVTNLLTEGDGNIAHSLVTIHGTVCEIARYHSEAKDWEDEIEHLTVSVQELSRAITDSVSRLELDATEFERLDERLSLLEKLKRKYSCKDVPTLINFHRTMTKHLADLEGCDLRLDELRAELKEVEKEVLAQGTQLTQQRAQQGAHLAKALTRELRDLGFLKADFRIQMTSHAPDASGCDTITFTFAPNPGEGARPLADIASTGEIARVMLAVKTVIAEHDEMGTLVFDEIDSNIGGEVGRAVGQKLSAVAKLHQVIAITHLPQSAAYGAHHFAVSKAVHLGRTRAAIQLLSPSERIAELARMLGGTQISSVVKQHAAELLAFAQHDAHANS